MPNIVGLIDGGWTDVQIPDISPSGGSWHMGTLLCVVWGRSVWDSVHKREIRWRGFYPHHLSRVNKKQSPCSLEELHLVQLFIFVRKKCV